MDELTRLKICRLIAGLVVADEDFDEREEAFVNKMLARRKTVADIWRMSPAEEPARRHYRTP